MNPCRTYFRNFKLVALCACALLLGSIGYQWKQKLVLSEVTARQEIKTWVNIAKEIDMTVTPPIKIDDTVDFMKDIDISPKQTIEAVYRKRMDHLKYVCASGETRPPVPPGKSNLQDKQVYIPSLNLTYCPAQEESRPPFSHLFKGVNDCQREGFKLSRDDLSGSGNHSLRVLYAGNPYWQMFTFYVNNILSPKQKHSAKMKSMAKSYDIAVDGEMCLVNVTFFEFISFALRSPFKMSVGGAWRRCNVCGGNYDVIATPETYLQDSLYIQNQLKVQNVTSKEEVERSHILEDVKELIVSTFMEKDTSECFSSYALLLRLWRQLQIWGYISINETYPYSREHSDDVTMAEFLKKVLDLFKKVLYTSTEDAFTLAYSDVPLKEMERLRKFYFEEFFAFGYNDRPASLFFKQGPRSKFPYFDVITLV